MKSIKKIDAVISKITDLTKTAKEIKLTLNEPLPFIAGEFVNVFLEHHGQDFRRAFSISSDDNNNNEINLSIRLTLNGTVTPLFWQEDFTGRRVKVMGPLGLNTADKMLSNKIYLFGFGIGAGVVRSLAMHHLRNFNLQSLVIITGNRSETEIVHQDYFDGLKNDGRVTVQYVISDPVPNSLNLKGYIQEHLFGFDFNDADVYICGQMVACEALKAKINEYRPVNCAFFVEAFH